MKLYQPSRVSRRLGEKFFFKAFRDFTSKSAMIRRPYPPGVHGKSKKRGRGGSSEFGAELKEKQKVRYTYGLSDTQLKKYIRSTLRAKGKTRTQALFETLERRLDNIVFKLGFASSRRIARQIVSHSHIRVNNKAVRSPSRPLRPGDAVTIRETSQNLGLFEGLSVRLKKYQPPEWLEINIEEKSGKMTRLPAVEDNLTAPNLNKVIEYYSR